MPESGVLVWMDLEMTGLDPQTDRIIEIATLVTDSQLRIIEQGPELVIHQPEALISQMDDWNRTQHGESGLIDRVRRSETSEQQACRATLDFISRFCERRSAPLAGNSIHQDRRFLSRYMPELDSFLHYRNVDVSTIKELARRWYPEVLSQAPPKRKTHRALEDVLESVEELRFYREQVFR